MVHAFVPCVRLREYNVTIGVALPDDSSSLASLYIMLYEKKKSNEKKQSATVFSV